MSSSETLLNHLDGDGILRLTLNDADRRNALSERMMADLTAAIAEAGADAAVRVIVLAANGPAFCAGHDLKEITAARAAGDSGQADFTRIMAACSAMMQSIVTCPKPVIAEVAGVATAAGCQLVASCDLAFAAETAQFATPGVNIGLFCSTPMVALSRNLSAKHAMEMLLTGDMISAARAVEIGLVNRAVPMQDLRDVTQDVASKIASKSSMTLSTGKRAFYAQREMSLADAYEHASRVMVENLLAKDAEEGIGAFIAKRPPQWQDS
ncbi:enoyl-CoA hydratase [uncultured Erythrobacter sp.]|uniref:enoyl-CoA hydratase n=1 Tax=uncultured Erythrobacter sp. TaxID=263913 RepID=UPI0026146B5D|nr:enoyl-CoA hydratase [uncultured Erythrobacter sp.]